MSSDYWVGHWKIPSEKRPEVEAYLKEQGLEWLFQIRDEKDHPEFAWVRQQRSDMTTSDPELVDKFLETLAKLLAHTSCDGQANEYNYDEDTGLKVLAGGSVEDLPDGICITLPQGYTPESGPVLLDALLIPLPGEANEKRLAVVHSFSIHEGRLTAD